MTISEPVLLVDGLSVGYRVRGDWSRPVSDVSFSLSRGETLAVVGESGSGKSSIVNALVGSLPDNGRLFSGSIRLAGEELVGLPRRRLRAIHGKEIGFVPQDPTVSLNPVRRIGPQLEEAFLLHTRMRQPSRRAAALELLEQVGLPDPARTAASYPHQLSGGMRQRVLIASAVALRPRVIIADEPTSGLDVTVQKRILDLLDSVQRETGTAIVLVTHNLAVAADRAHRLLVLHHGEIVEEGPSSSVLSDPRHAYTRRLIDAIPRAEHSLRRTQVSDEKPVLEAASLTKRFRSSRRTPSFLAVDDLSFSVGAGRTLAIVGESGSGKSTTARMLVKLEAPSSGRVMLGGDDITDIRERDFRSRRHEIQFVYQNPRSSLDPLLSARSIVEEPLRAFGIGDPRERRSRAISALRDVGIGSELLERRPRELSGGQQQRVAIARAIVTEPRVLVLDEPVSALDVSIQAQVLELLVRLQKEKSLSYVFISHDLAVVAEISDDVLVLERGRVVEYGPTEAVLSSPSSAYTRDLIAAVPGESLPQRSR